MPRTTERVMRGCFPPVRRPALPSSQETSRSAAGTGSSSRPSPVSRLSPAPVIDDDVLYQTSEAESEADAARLSTAIASRRFFFASPGLSNSIVDSTEHSAPRPRGVQPTGDSTAVNTRALRRAATSAFPAAPPVAAGRSAKPKRAPSSRLRYEDIHPVQVTSREPRADFLESMVEMADSLGLDPRRGAGDIAALQELLLCYIAVNEHNALGDIIGAYADLLCLFGDNNADQSRDAGAQNQTRAQLGSSTARVRGHRVLGGRERLGVSWNGGR